MKRVLYLPCVLSLVACSVEPTSSVASAINEDPGATSMSFHSPSGISFTIRSVTPMGQADPIYMKFEGVDGSTGDGSKHDAMFLGDVLGAADAVTNAAAIAPLAAMLLGVATPDQVQETTGLTYGAIQVKYVDQSPPRKTAELLVRQAAAYAALLGGTPAGVQANSWLIGLGIDPCPPEGIK
jgi:hypothetical protein